jgi:type II secretory pathway pseudopilin PulG
MAKSSPRPFEHAFTLIELLVVIATIIILAALVVSVSTGVIERAKATKDISNLRQIALATQTYLNDSDGVLFSPGTSWSSQLNPKYFSAWRGFQSAFDKRASSEAGTGTPVSPISYGVNSKIYPSGAAMSATKITKPTAFILFAPAQTSAATVNFLGVATTAAPGVTLLGNSGSVTSSPGGVATGGTHNSRRRISVLFADLHCENMLWTAFTSTTANPGEPDQWTPYIPYP